MNKLDTFISDRQISGSTINFYNSCVKLYEEVNNGLSLDKLLIEADREEEHGIRWKNRKIKTRLIQFRNYLFANKSEGTAKRYLSGIRTIYSHFEIELQDLPSFKSKQIDKTFKMEYEDLLTKSEIIDGYYEANNVTKFLIVFAISTGLSKADMLKMTVQEFIQACGVQEEKLLDSLYQIKGKDIIPCFRGSRQKTGTNYTTFCSPEAVEHGVQYLIGRDATIKETYQKFQDIAKNSDDLEKRQMAMKKLETLPTQLEPSHKLFDVSNAHLSYTFRKINKKLGLGKVGKFSKYRCHMLRKYHASTLLNSEIVTWTVEEIDTLQGRSMDMTHQAYFKNSKDKLYKKYCLCVDELMLFKEVNGVDHEVVERLEKENNFFKKEIVKNEEKLEEQQRTIEKIIENQQILEDLFGLN